MKQQARYILTERVRHGAPLDSDPLAQACRKFSGVFDLRDTGSAGVICATSANLRGIRGMQARLNSMQLCSI